MNHLFYCFFNQLYLFALNLPFLIKDGVVGDLTIQDITNLYYQKEPKLNINKEVNIIQFGLIGSVFGLNRVYIRPIFSHDLLNNRVLNAIDHIDGSRNMFKTLDRIFGFKTIVSMSSQKGLNYHKKFASMMPNYSKVIELAMQRTLKVISSNKLQVDGKESKKLVHSILHLVLLGVSANNEYFDVYLLMQAAMLNPNKKSIASACRKWLSDILSHHLDGGIVNENSILYKYILSVKKYHPDRHELKKYLLDDPIVHTCFASIVTAENIHKIFTVVFHQNLFKYGVKPYLSLVQKEINQSITSISHAQAINQSDLLNLLFLEALSQSIFNPQELIRYTSKAINIGQYFIPAGTTIFCSHRSLEKKKSYEIFNPVRFKNSDIKLGSTSLAPFSMGCRKCPGDKISESIFKGIVGAIVLSLDFSANNSSTAFTQSSCYAILSFNFNDSPDDVSQNNDFCAFAM